MSGLVVHVHYVHCVHLRIELLEIPYRGLSTGPYRFEQTMAVPAPTWVDFAYHHPFCSVIIVLIITVGICWCMYQDTQRDRVVMTTTTNHYSGFAVSLGLRHEEKVTQIVETSGRTFKRIQNGTSQTKQAIKGK